MNIPNEILDKYHVGYGEKYSERDTYMTFLNVTDFEIIKGFESLLAEPLKLMTNIVTLAKTLSEVSKYRQIAREELEKQEVSK